MPKLKTKQKAAKRFRITKNGKILARKTGRRHLLGTKKPKRKRHMRRNLQISGGMAKSIRSQMPNV